MLLAHSLYLKLRETACGHLDVDARPAVLEHVGRGAGLLDLSREVLASETDWNRLLLFL